ncbi:MAG: restriction endonuclease subunit S [Candidatus Riflebacteria bacterium]|nr:restriction endonuclease subunit S [Candidatus Riflebacteria bacterium]
MKPGWQIKKIGEVCQIRGGGTPSKAISKYWQGDIPWVSPKDMKFDIVSDSIDHITAEAVAKSATSVIPKGSMLMVVRSGILANTVPLAITGRELTVNQDLKAICPSQSLTVRFLYYFLKSKMNELLSMVSRGATVHRLMTDQIRDIEILVPPIAEQQRIVAILDEAFAGIATAKANAEKNLQNSRALFESHLDAVFSCQNEKWLESQLQTITTKIGSGATPRGGEAAYKSEGISLIRSLNVHDMGFRYEKLAFLDDAQANDLSNVVLEPNDVLLNITGASVARCCIAPIDVLPARVNQHVSIIRPVPEELDSRFLHYLLISGPYKKHLLQTGEEGGSTRQALTKAQIQALKIRYPNTLKVQLEIVGKLDSFLEKTQHLEAIYKKKLIALEELKKSLLHQAFDGELG